MNELTERLASKYEPVQAIVIYKSNDSEYYLESHAIDANGRLQEGVPLSTECLTDVAKSIKADAAKRPYHTGFLPNNVIEFAVTETSHCISWWNKQELRPIFFHDQLNIPSGTAWVPPLLYRVSNSSLSVYALPFKTRKLTSKTALMQAPFHNVSSQGNVCIGNAKVQYPKDPQLSQLIQYWEKVFWASEFSHLAANHSPVKSNLNSLWKSLVNTDKRFPEAELIPSPLKTIARLYEKNTLR